MSGIRQRRAGGAQPLFYVIVAPFFSLFLYRPANKIFFVFAHQERKEILDRLQHFVFPHCQNEVPFL